MALELGCGVGHGVRHLLAKGFHVVAIDGEPEAIEIVRCPDVEPAAERTVGAGRRFEGFAHDADAGVPVFFRRDDQGRPRSDEGKYAVVVDGQAAFIADEEAEPWDQPMQVRVVANPLGVIGLGTEAEGVHATDGDDAAGAGIESGGHQADLRTEGVAQKVDAPGVDDIERQQGVEGGARVGDHSAHERPARIALIELPGVEDARPESDLIEGQDGEAAFDQVLEIGAALKRIVAAAGRPG